MNPKFKGKKDLKAKVVNLRSIKMLTCRKMRKLKALHIQTTCPEMIKRHLIF